MTATFTSTQLKILRCAHDLFDAHGVTGTSLQMIANAVGVSKAAIYHQFPAKDDIVLAVAEVELGGLKAAVAAAVADPSLAAREALLEQVIEMAVARRGGLLSLGQDPGMVKVLGQHEFFATLMEQLFSVLLGQGSGEDRRLQAAVLSAAISGAIAHPFVADLDDETIKVELLRITRRLVALPE
jgi:AcrR family transcriptional regulator